MHTYILTHTHTHTHTQHNAAPPEQMDYDKAKHTDDTACVFYAYSCVCLCVCMCLSVCLSLPVSVSVCVRLCLNVCICAAPPEQMDHDKAKHIDSSGHEQVGGGRGVTHTYMLHVNECSVHVRVCVCRVCVRVPCV